MTEKIVLVQLSDVHMGSEVENVEFGGPGSLRAGLNGHDDLLCPILEQALADVPTDTGLPGNQPYHVLVSGDSTRVGSDRDFAIANTYLLSRIAQHHAGADAMGLGCKPAHLHTIPGNHDHWGGHAAWPQRSYAHPFHCEAAPP
jgi:hypothetical protein